MELRHLNYNAECGQTATHAVQMNAFEVASDAFTTFERLLTKHDIVADFLNSQFQRFFSQYEQLLQSEANYATQRQVCILLALSGLVPDGDSTHNRILFWLPGRIATVAVKTVFVCAALVSIRTRAACEARMSGVQSLKLLHDILLEKRNVHVMFQYVKSKRQLMLVMNLLRSSSKSIQYEAFHVFKVFVANPKKPRDIRGILIGNRDKLLRFLKQLLVDRGKLL